MAFDYANNMNIYVSINGNDNKGFNNLNSQMKLTQWSKNGHYYLYIPEQLSWSKAYNKAMDFKLAGQQGYVNNNEYRRIGLSREFESRKDMGSGNKINKSKRIIIK